jgi:hypothetical protein
MSCFSLVLDNVGSSLFESIFLASQRSSLGGVIFSKSSSTISSNFSLLIVFMDNKINQNHEELNRDGSKSLQFLKILVVVMGVMIIAGLIIVFVTIFQRITSKTNFSSEASYSLTEEIPKSFKLKDVAIGDGKIGVRFQDDKGENFIIFYNVDDGKQIGRLTFSFSK